MKKLFILIGLGIISCLLFYGISVSAASYSPYDVNTSTLNKKTKGDRAAEFNTGKKLVYDVYNNSGNKSGWSIANRNYGKGTQPYLEFSGWSAIAGYKHHTGKDEDTYIWLKNRTTGANKYYLMEQVDIDASKDLEYNRQSATGPITNPCPSNAMNKTSDQCNMYYKDVGFKAHIPLNEIFPSGSEKEKWEFRIIKRVGSKVLYDELRVPFEFNDITFNYGKLNLSSGLNAQQLRMNTNLVARRTKPRETGYSGKYFTENRFYQKQTQNQSGAVVWYGVSSPHDGGAIRYAASPYWNFGGDIATLSYQISTKKCPDGTVVNLNQSCTVSVTITHKDSSTNKVLKTDKKKATVGKSYSYSPEPKGTFKDANGNPYVASPISQKVSGKTPSNNMSFTFLYKASKKDPSYIEKLSGSTEGKVKGEYIWKLSKPVEDKQSIVYLENNIQIDGIHYETRNIENSISSQGVFSENADKPLSLTINPASVKDKKVDYKYSYEYTNYYQVNYKCVDQQGEECFEWTYKNTTPVWDSSHRKIVHWDKQLTLNHHHGEVYNVESNVDKKLLVGQTLFQNGVTKDYHEEFSIPNTSQTNLMTQTWLPIFENPLSYKVNLAGEKFHLVPNVMSFYPIEVDANLRSQFLNKTPYAYSEYAISLKALSTVKSGDLWKTSFVPTKEFFMTKDTGFVFSIPYDSSKSSINEAAKKEFESYTSTDYEDEVIINSKPKYYIPIDPKSELSPGQVYKNWYVIGQLGLSDVTFHFGQAFSFQKYLLGSIHDQVYVNEQHETILDVKEYPHSITIDNSQREKLINASKDRKPLLHSLRTSDDKHVLSKIKSIININ